MSFAKIKNTLFNFICENKMLQFFLWDYQTGRICFSAHPFVLPISFKKKRYRYLDELKHHLQPDDYKAINDYLCNLPISPKRLAHNSFYLRIFDDNGSCYWLKLFLIAQKESKASCHIFGLIENVSDEMHADERQKKFIYALEHDSLTNTYNKETFIRFTNNFLAAPQNKDQIHAMLIIDADNFKDINDTLGHLFGDSVLKEIADKLRHHFRTDDFIARMGGDEYAVLMRNLKSVDFLKEKFNLLLKDLSKTYHSGNHFVNFSMSIGVAFYPENGKNFQSLFSHADIALYTSKRAGKSCFTFYNPNLITSNYFYQSDSLKTSYNRRLQFFQKNTAEYIFRLFYKNKDIDSIIEHCLKMLGIMTNADRALLFLYEPSTDSFQLTHFYSSGRHEPISPQVRDKYLPLAAYFVVKTFFKHLSHGIIATCDDINSLPEEQRETFQKLRSKSFIQCLIRRGNTVLGSIGIDNRTKCHHWTEAEINQLSILASCFSFLIMQRNISIQYQLEKPGVKNEL